MTGTFVALVFDMRKYFDCHEGGEGACELHLAGREAVVIEAVVGHLVSAHARIDTNELRGHVRAALREERTSTQSERPSPTSEIGGHPT